MTKAYVILGALVMAIYLVVPRTASDVLYVLVGLSCVAAIVVGVRVNRPLKRTPWLLLAAGQAAAVTGDILFATVGTDRRTPSAADIAFLVSYLLLAAGIGALIRDRRPRHDVPGLVDSAIVTIGFGLLLWVFVASPILENGEVPAIERAVDVAYPVCDILLLAMALRLMTVPGTRSASFRLMIGAIVPLIVADAVWAATATDAGALRQLDLLWIASYVLRGAAALHPTMAQLSSPTNVRVAPFTSRRLVALTCAVLIGPLLMVAQWAFGLRVEVWVVVLAASAVSLLVVWRMAYNIEEIRATVLQRDRLQADLCEQSSRDLLTGLSNGPHMRELIGAALRRSRTEGPPVSLLLVGLDDFTQVNDQFGHGVGDAALSEVGHRFQEEVRDSGSVGRMGGVQYVVLIDPGESERDAVALAGRLLAAVQRPIRVGGQRISATACVGVATSLDGGTDPDALLHQGGIALRRAHDAGRGQIELFGQALRSEIGELAKVEAALAAGMSNGDLEIWYRPVVAVRTEILDGYEAQIVWRHPSHGVQDPDSFLALAAASDLICQLDRWLLSRATGAMADLTAADPARFEDLTISVTISGRTLADPGMVDHVRAVLHSSGLEPHRLTIGVTEMVLVDVPNVALPLAALRRAGVFVCIEDFGTGRTPIAQLQHLPADALKIDRELLTSTHPGADDLLRLLVDAAHGCGLLVVADGVDGLDGLDSLRTLACDSALGMYAATPRPSDGLVATSPVDPKGRQLWIVPEDT
ncbi:hypothetical protein C6I20_09940 [Aeromicrobium sp. A1-2]|uniref:putative bifunctional diguanylate cyclase/phosphodiesterase n=1 Tax=Aeromicrobium sp. A1-2 TaxID=2107713 RepID=UPI000E514E45|nr:EAL domain-containing protein [Aeromicrobium sp. A1-2]AXT85477.1 hypothetical protein C6I20_09940 [Aeromicrobium sp. A1-2]